MFYYFQVYENNKEQILQIKKLNENKIEKNNNFINYFKQNK